MGELLLVYAYVLGAVWGIELLIGSGAGPFAGGRAGGLGQVGALRHRHDAVAGLAERRYEAPSKLLGMIRGGMGQLHRLGRK